MNAQKVLQQIKKAPKFGKLPYIKDKDGHYRIFSTLDKYGNLRDSNWRESLEKAKKYIGNCPGFPDKDILELAKDNNWQIGYIDISEFFDRSGFKKGMKVRSMNTGRIGKITNIGSIGANVDFFEDECIKHLPYENMEPVYEEDDDYVDITIEGKAKEALKRNTVRISRRSAKELGLIE